MNLVVELLVISLNTYNDGKKEKTQESQLQDFLEPIQFTYRITWQKKMNFLIKPKKQYFQRLLKFAGYKLFNKRSPLYGSADIINVCNLHCDHCYWWLNRKENEELTVEQWKKIIDEKFKKLHDCQTSNRGMA